MSDDPNQSGGKVGQAKTTIKPSDPGKLGQDNPSQGNPRKGRPGQGNPGQGNPGQPLPVRRRPIKMVNRTDRTGNSMSSGCGGSLARTCLANEIP